MSQHSTPPPSVAYSYIRFSHPEQSKGDSLRRQTEAAVEWCQRNGACLDTSTTLHDLGKSAYTGAHRSNPDRHALAAFLKLVESGKVPHGSYLVLENLDRLSREEEVPACHLLTGILMAGVRVVQLKPSELILTEKSNGFDIMRAVMELSRGHGESAIKSERIGGAWREKKRRARNGETQRATNRMGEGCRFLTRQLPAWIEDKGGKLHLIPEKAAAVKRIFALAGAGYGHVLIIKKLALEGVAPFGNAPWSRGYISRILNDRRAVGEFQPRRKRGTETDGEAIANYFPAIVTEQQFQAARAGQEQRFRKRGRVAKHINVFAALLFNAREGDTYVCTTRPTGGNRGPKRMQRLLINRNALEGKGQSVSFPFVTFERAVLSCFREIDPHEILNGDSRPDESLVLAGELARVEAKIAEIEAELLEGDVAALARVLRRLEEEKAMLVTKLTEARQKAANPLSASWGEAQSLLSALESAPDKDDVRLRLRAAIRRIVDSIWLLSVPRGRDRLAAVQIWFAGGKRRRDYLILHRPPKANKSARVEGGWWCRSLAGIVGGADLRNREDALAYEAELRDISLDELESFDR
jgi:DNA invertase Pin-like site-specific DNA recombinase